jgi:septum site-determining protein MinD
MMQGVITVHSYKGGTGKSLVSANLAAILAREGKSVCVIDLDMHAPSLDKTFGVDGRKFWVNDFLAGKCEPTDILFDVAKVRKLEGKLFVALANPSMVAIRESVSTDKKQEMRSLRRLFTLKEHLMGKLAMDYVILDTGPGLNYASINAVTVSDIVLLLTTWDKADLSGTQGMVSEICRMLDKRSIVIMNKIPEQLIIDEATKNRLIDQFSTTLKLPVVDLLPCYCDVLRQDRATIMALERPRHAFSQRLVGVARHIEGI